MTRSITVRIAIPVAAVGAILIAAMLVVNTAIGEYRESARTVVRSERLIGQANEAKNLLLDAETGLRGFVVTGEDRFLQPLGRAARDYESAAQTLVAGATGSAVAIAQRIRGDGLGYLRDYAQPLAADLQADSEAHSSAQVLAGGKARLDVLRREFDEFVSVLQSTNAASTSSARSYGERAKWVTIASIAVIVVLLIGLVVYLWRSIARPIRQAATAAQAIGAGQLDRRLPEGRSDEIGQLGKAFNEMASSLESSAAEVESQNAELESQNAELESQTVELEAQAAELENAQQELAANNEELVGKQAELERSASSLEAANHRITLYAEVSDKLARHPDLRDRAETALAAVADLAGAEIGALYAHAAADQTALTLQAVRGMGGDILAAAMEPDEGLAGRAIAERRVLTVPHPDGDLRLRSFGAPVTIRHEMHVPLVHGDTPLGVLSIGRIADRPFSPEEIEAVEHLAELAAVAIDNALMTDRAQSLADINRAVLDATRDGIALINLDGRTVLANPAMQRMTQEAAADDTDLIGTIEDPRADAFEEIELAGSGRWFRRYTTPVSTADGTPVGRIFVLSETTAQHNADRLKDELMATVSHELRTPLAAILGFTELLLHREFSPEERAAATETIHQQAERLSSLIDDFLDLQRLEDHQLKLQDEVIDLRELLREQVALYQAQSDAHAITLRVPDRPLTTRGDVKSLARVFGNLLSNAIKYSPDGGPVTVHAADDDGILTVSITDTGIGIPASARNRIFDRFFRVDGSATRSIGGTGLGLSLVRGIVREHNGNVTVDSLEGHGSTFSVTLPSAPTPAPTVSTD